MSKRPRDLESTQAIKSAPPREQGAVKDYWQRLDELFYRTIGHAEKAFKINVAINIIVVGVGITLLAYSIIYSWINSLDIYSTAFGSLGIVSFIAVFYFTPQKKIQETVGDLVQIQTQYRAFFMQAEAVNDWDYYNPKKTFEQLEKMNKHLGELANNVTDKIEACVGKKD